MKGMVKQYNIIKKGHKMQIHRQTAISNLNTPSVPGGKNVPFKSYGATTAIISAAGTSAVINARQKEESYRNQMIKAISAMISFPFFLAGIVWLSRKK